MTDAILVLNAGSSSIKFAVHSLARNGNTLLLHGKIENIGGTPDFTAHDATGKPMAEGGLRDISKASDHEMLTGQLLTWLEHHHEGLRLVGAGHRVVHGGRDFEGPVMLTPEIMQQLEALTSLAPLHQPHNLAAIRAVSTWAPKLRQVACFDTSFHRTQPRLAQLFALPRKLNDAGIIRYGFHGLSYEYIADILPDHLGDKARDRVIVAHLGNGASMCAIRDLKSVATTMGFTALHGLMMGRRCGTLDAGVVLHLIQEMHMDPDQVLHILYQESGLLGVSGISNNMHVLQDSQDPHAKEAIELYCYFAARELSALIPALGGLDTIIFTAGIGENSARVRQGICKYLNWLGVEIDGAANGSNATIISSADSAVSVLVIPTNEELVVANSVRSLLAGSKSKEGYPK